MFVRTVLDFNKIAADYLAAASFGMAKARQADAAKLSGTAAGGENPAYLVFLSTKARETSGPDENKEKDKKDEEDKAQNFAGELWRKGKSEAEQRRVEEEIKDLEQTQSNVVKHEQTHKSAGGQYTGAINYKRAAGPDGKQYIVGGEISIDTSEETTPQKTIAKMQLVRRAALAPADPSGADRAAASTASAKEAQARKELSAQMWEKGVQALKLGFGKAEGKKAVAFPVVFKDGNAREQEPTMGKTVDLSA